MFAMPRALWSGAITFGLVSIPVKMYGAVRDMGVHFHRLHAADGVRIHQKMVCPADDEEVQFEEIVRGYEVGPDEYVIVHEEELEALAPKASRIIEILDFVDLVEIDPIYYEHPYFLIPDEQAARPYSLLVKAMTDSRKVGIGKFVMRNKEYLAALRPLDGVVCLETMHFADEVVEAGEVADLPEQPEPSERELSMAKQLIDTLASSFEPQKYHDEYREAVMELVETKAEGQEFVAPQPEEEPGKVIDLMSALEQSLTRAKERKEKTG